jgi:glycosyltransferase involved in cell wall biosynthesis
MIYKATLIIPIYNEISSLNILCNKIKDTFQDIPMKFIFIDDGSKDGSANWLSINLKKIFKKNNFELINLKKNYGKGFAVKEGIKKIEGDYTLFIDSDLEYQPSDLHEMYNIITNNEQINVLYGSRNLGSKTQLRRYFLNGIAVKINTWIYNFLFNQSLTDLHTGSKIIDNNLLKKLNISTNGFGLEVVMSSEIAKKNINIFEYGISYYERSIEQGKKITFVDGLKSYYFLFRERFIQNDIQTQISLIYSFVFMFYAGTHFGMSIGKIMVIILFILIGLMIALNRKILPLSVIFSLTYIGSLFSKGNGKIYTTVFFFFIGLFVSKKISKYLLRYKSNSFLNFFL